MSIHCLPDDIIHHLLYYISPLDTLYNVQLTCRRLSYLTNDSLLWKHYCVQTFGYWQPRHEFSDNLRRPVKEVAWKRLFIIRHLNNGIIRNLFESVLATRFMRLKRIEEICDFMYDAKDFLLEQVAIDNAVQDVLSRRYWATAILDTIHKSIAIDTWQKIKNGFDAFVPLETALGAFDMFVLHDGPGDLDDISRILDDIAAEFRTDHCNLDQWTTRQKALALNRWLRSKNLLGLRNPQQDYRNLRNCLIGQALRHQDHESIPIVSCAIYCCVAERIELRARCCNFPSHVHVIVLPPNGQNLDNQPTRPSREVQDKMFLNPYGSDNEIPEENLQRLLADMPGAFNIDSVMNPVSKSQLVVRTRNNILSTSLRVRSQRERASSHLTELIHGSGGMNMSTCLYAGHWATAVLGPRDVDWLLSIVKVFGDCCETWPQDSFLLERFIVPRLNKTSRIPAENVESMKRSLIRLRCWDRVQPTPLHRSDPNLIEKPPFKIGQVFRHRSYDWLGVITGWGIPPRKQLPYFTYTRTIQIDGSSLVAGRNIEIITDSELVKQTKFLNLGQHFKRFDSETCRFVSNIREEYPED